MKMSKWNANREGYADNTASIAIQRVSKKKGRTIWQREAADEQLTRMLFTIRL